MVLGRNTAACIQHKQNNIGLRHSLACLFGHFFVNAGGGVGFEATGIDNNELQLSKFAVAIVAIPGQPSIVRHNGVTRLGQTIEECRFPHIGAPD